MTARKRIKGELVTRVQTGSGESDNAHDVAPTWIGAPLHDNLTSVQVIGLGFRQEMLTVGEKPGPHGGVSTGAGFGSGAILLEWNGRKAVLYGQELFKAWVATFAPEDAERMQ
jgi:hypothetical protein